MFFALVTAICACFFPTFFAFIKRKPKMGTWTMGETFLVLVFVLALGWSWGQILFAILKTHPETLILGNNPESISAFGMPLSYMPALPQFFDIR